METAAYWMALATVVLFPSFLSVWFIIHPFIHTWRRLGPAKTYLIVAAIVLAMMAALFAVRGPLLSVRFGVRPAFVIAGGLLFAASLAIGIPMKRRFPIAALLGLPEVSPPAAGGRLITEGIYARLRHPRYVQVGLGLAAFALFTNYLALYALLAAYLPTVYAVVLLEERELRERFGEEYERYCRQVPRFMPRTFGQRAGDA
ncbi:MAG TPA: methyltransferase [Armatimonadota bacterium]|nr:methyltransferase [Armatimonadota bacterium]